MSKRTKCIFCGEILEDTKELSNNSPYNGHIVYKKYDNYGNRAIEFPWNGMIRYSCLNCTDKRAYHSGDDKQQQHISTNKQSTLDKDRLMYGIEVELSKYDRQLSAIFRSFQFNIENDGSVEVEYTSPKSYNFSSFAKVLKTCSKHPSFQTNDDCGTHFSVSTNGDVPNMEIIRRFYHSFLLTLSNEMEKSENYDRNVKLFGRSFVYYASPINSASCPTDHRNFISCEKTNRIEFRICKINSSDPNCIENYMNTINLCREMYKLIVKYAQKIKDIDDSLHTAEEKRQIARECSNCLVDLYYSWK